MTPLDRGRTFPWPWVAALGALGLCMALSGGMTMVLPLIMLGALGMAAMGTGAPEDTWWRRITWNQWTAILLAVLFLYRLVFVIRGVYLPALEEMQYWDWSRRLDLSYYSKPPMIAYLIRASCTIFGDTPLGIRFVAVLLALLGSIVTWALVLRMFGSPRTAFLCVLMINIMPLFWLGGIILTTDTPLMFFWGIAIFALWLALFEGKHNAWWLFGAAFGFGMLSKYAMAYILLCLVVFLLLSREHRFALKKPQFYLSFVLGILMLTPVIIWNINHDWVTAKHVAADAAVPEGFKLNPGSFFEYIGVQALLTNPIVHFFMFFFAWRLFRRDGLAMDGRWKFLLAMGVPVYSVLLLKSAQDTVQGNWAAPAYLTWTIFAVAYFERFCQEGHGEKILRRLRATAIVGIILPLLGIGLLMERIFFNTFHAAATSVGISLPANIDPAYQFTGWRVLGRQTTDALATMPNPERTFIVSWSYQVCAAVAFHGEGQPRTYGITFPQRGQRMHQYTIWGGADETKKGWDAISVNRGGGRALDPRVADQFERVEGPFRIEVYEKGKLYRRFTYYKCYNFSGEFPKALDPTDLESMQEITF
ncbi:MAG: glycosyltransferase family 39 protein [Candidatus Sumerlaeia bacterium]|nr:glycosyltransferase family 39 protein [Candidatus Sumerlaeia bacterium]